MVGVGTPPIGRITRRCTPTALRSALPVRPLAAILALPLAGAFS